MHTETGNDFVMFELKSTVSVKSRFDFTFTEFSIDNLSPGIRLIFHTDIEFEFLRILICIISINVSL